MIRKDVDFGDCEVGAVDTVCAVYTEFLWTYEVLLANPAVHFSEH